MVDEVDHLSSDLDLGHFMKMLHETLTNTGIQGVTFILAGQQGIYSRLISQDPSVERLVRHVPLSILDSDACEYILDYAARYASTPYSYEEKAKGLILSLSSGFPYVVHLLGDASFQEMSNPYEMAALDVLRGLETVLQSDKREKYLARLKGLTDRERQLLRAAAGYRSDRLPAVIPISWLKEVLAGDEQQGRKLVDITLDSLESKGHLIVKKGRRSCTFGEELFRVFVLMARREREELESKRAGKRSQAESQDQELVQREIPLDMTKHLHRRAESRTLAIEKIKRSINNAKYETEWGEDDLLEYMEDDDDEAENWLNGDGVVHLEDDLSDGGFSDV